MSDFPPPAPKDLRNRDSRQPQSPQTPKETPGAFPPPQPGPAAYPPPTQPGSRPGYPPAPAPQPPPSYNPRPGEYSGPGASPDSMPFEPTYERPRPEVDYVPVDQQIELDEPYRDDPYSGRGGRQRASARDRNLDISIDDFDQPDLRRDVRGGRERSAPRGRNDNREAVDSRRPAMSGSFLTERQIEALGWGVTVILLGIAILLAFTSNSQFLTVGFPVISGLLLLGTSVYQRLHHMNVSMVTWLTAIGLVAFSITRLIGISDGEGTTIGQSIAYFLGTFTIITGIVVLVRIFQNR